MGGAYWAKYISYILTYGAYGDGTGRNAGICALGEAWGFHMGYFLTLQEFGASNRIITQNGFENFIPNDRPYNPIYSNRNWIPKGLMNDIIDTNRDYIRAGYYDNVSGYTLRNIYNALDGDVTSPQAFRDRLLRENNNKDETDLRNLFEAYFWD